MKFTSAEYTDKVLNERHKFSFYRSNSTLDSSLGPYVGQGYEFVITQTSQAKKRRNKVAKTQNGDLKNCPAPLLLEDGTADQRDNSDSSDFGSDGLSIDSESDEIIEQQIDEKD